VLIFKLAFNDEPPIRESEEERKYRQARERAAKDLTPEEQRAARQREGQEQARRQAERFAKRLHALCSLSVTLKWRYRRQRLPWQRREASTEGKGRRVIELGPDVVEDFREACCEKWKQSRKTDHLAKIARVERAGE
jgi:hypothetical protein